MRFVWQTQADGHDDYNTRCVTFSDESRWAYNINFCEAVIGRQAEAICRHGIDRQRDLDLLDSELLVSLRRLPCTQPIWRDSLAADPGGRTTDTRGFSFRKRQAFPWLLDAGYIDGYTGKSPF